MKKTVINSLFAVMSLLILLICTIEINLINSKLNILTKQYSLLQKIQYSFPIRLIETQKMISKDEAEILVKNYNFSDKIYTNSGKNYYIYLKDNDKTFGYFSAQIGNLGKTTKNINEILTASFVYDNKYEFECAALEKFEDYNSYFDSYSNNLNLAPLEKKNIHFVAKIPKYLLETNKNISFVIKTSSKKYILKVNK